MGEICVTAAVKMGVFQHCAATEIWTRGDEKGVLEARRRESGVIALIAPAEMPAMTAMTALALVAGGRKARRAAGVELRHLTSSRAVIPVRLVTNGGESITTVVTLAAEVAVVAVAAGVEASVAVAAEAAVAIAVAAAAGAVAGVGVEAAAEGVVQRGHGYQRHAGSDIAVVESTTIPAAVAVAVAVAAATATAAAVTGGPQEEIEIEVVAAAVAAVQGAEVLTGVGAGAVPFAGVAVQEAGARVAAAIGAAVRDVVAGAEATA